MRIVEKVINLHSHMNSLSLLALIHQISLQGDNPLSCERNLIYYRVRPLSGERFDILP